MSESRLGLPYTVVSTDIVGSGAGGHSRHVPMGEAAQRAVDSAIQQFPDWERWICDSHGDGNRILVPADVPKAKLLVDFLARIRQSLHEYNRNKADDHKVRIRVGMDFGDVYVNENSIPLGGESLVGAARLREAQQARDVQKRDSDISVVAVISDYLYQQAVPEGDLGLQPRSFRRVLVSEKELETVGWLHVPGPGIAPADELTARVETASAHAKPSGTAGGSPAEAKPPMTQVDGSMFSGDFTVSGGTFVGRDQHNHGSTR